MKHLTLIPEHAITLLLAITRLTTSLHASPPPGVVPAAEITKSLGNALGAPNVTWSTGGTSPWVAHADYAESVRADNGRAPDLDGNQRDTF